MSKASEWAKLFVDAKNAKPPGLITDGAEPTFGAHVCDDGKMYLASGGAVMWLAPSAALSLARWILDTFGERP